MYVDDPCLKDAKTIYSIYSDEFKTSFRPNFPDKLKMDGALDNDLADLKKETNFMSLTKLAIDFADGVIQGSQTIHPEIQTYLSGINDKPVLPYQSPDVYIDEINKFYDTVLGV
jgi:starch synthase